MKKLTAKRIEKLGRALMDISMTATGVSIVGHETQVALAACILGAIGRIITIVYGETDNNTRQRQAPGS